jgi:hypothetical protein
MREAARVDEALDRLPQGDEGADEDGENNRQAGEPLSRRAAKEEREPERDRGERVSEVVDQVGKQRDAQRPCVDERLRERRDRQDREAPGDGADAGVRSEDRTIDESERRKLGFMVPLVFTQNRAVRGAEMTHPTKLPDSARDEQQFPLRGRPQQVELRGH